MILAPDQQKSTSKCSRLVGVTGLEPATSASQTPRATNCAKPRTFGYYIIYLGYDIVYI